MFEPSSASRKWVFPQRPCWGDVSPSSTVFVMMGPPPPSSTGRALPGALFKAPPRHGAAEAAVQPPGGPGVGGGQGQWARL